MSRLKTETGIVCKQCEMPWDYTYQGPNQVEIREMKEGENKIVQWRLSQILINLRIVIWRKMEIVIRCYNMRPLLITEKSRVKETTIQENIQY
jgi:hypothetical protein